MGQSFYMQHIYVDPGRQPGAAGPPHLTYDDAMRVQLGLFSLALKVIEKKRIDYSGVLDPYRNLRSALVVGIEPWRGALVRLMDKVSRIARLAESGREVKDESILDSFIDLINYACIAAGLIIESLPGDKRESVMQLLASEAMNFAEQSRTNGDR